MKTLHIAGAPNIVFGLTDHDDITDYFVLSGDVEIIHLNLYEFDVDWARDNPQDYREDYDALLRAEQINPTPWLVRRAREMMGPDPFQRIPPGQLELPR